MTGLFGRINAWIENLASTNFKIVVGSFLALSTGVFYFGSEIGCRDPLRCRPIDSTNFGLWLAFVAAWASISYAQFAKKRDTYASPSPDSARAKVPDSPPPSTPKKDDP